MKAYIATRADKGPRPEFQAPGNIVVLPIDQATGGVAVPGSTTAVSEAFIAGTQPGGLNRQ